MHTGRVARPVCLADGKMNDKVPTVTSASSDQLIGNKPHCRSTRGKTTPIRPTSPRVLSAEPAPDCEAVGVRFLCTTCTYTTLIPPEGYHGGNTRQHRPKFLTKIDFDFSFLYLVDYCIVCTTPRAKKPVIQNLHFVAGGCRKGGIMARIRAAEPMRETAANSAEDGAAASRSGDIIQNEQDFVWRAEREKD